MSSKLIQHAVAFAAAASTTLMLFSTVVSLADQDKAALADAQSARTLLAQNITPVQP